MFRRPTEISSDSSSDEEAIDLSTAASDVDGAEDINISTTLSISSNGDVTASETQEAEPLPNARHHSNMMLASLLEDLVRTRAAELINAGMPGASFTRSSPEVQPLARKIFEHVSGVFASNGLLPPEVSSDDQQNARRQYLVGIDNIGLQALKDSDLLVSQGSSSLPLTKTDLALVKPQGPQPGTLSMLLSDSIANLHGRNASFPPQTSPYVDTRLSLPSPTHSRYGSDFQEIKMLGKGGFGYVYHALNFVDNQHYAIKRIPLNAKMAKRWQESGHEGADSILREIRTLARLEHCNIVRYHNAWIEKPQNTPRMPEPAVSSFRPVASQRLLADKRVVRSLPQQLPGARRMPVHSRSGDAILFDREPRAAADATSQTESAGTCTDGQSESTVSLSGSEIFTDGRSLGISASRTSPEYASAYVLHVQMSIHPLTLTTYLSPLPSAATSSALQSVKRHCYHVIPSLRLLIGILCGLQYLHAMNIVHRDIKPGNILLSEYTGLIGPTVGFYDVGSCSTCLNSSPYYLNPRIADFGLVADITHAERLPATLAKKVVGTERYRPPTRRLADGDMEKIDQGLDVYALGVLLFEMLWRFHTKMERHIVLNDLQHGKLPKSFATTINMECGHHGERLSACILGMVNRDAKERWSCNQVRECAEAILASHHPHPGPQ